MLFFRRDGKVVALKEVDSDVETRQYIKNRVKNPRNKKRINVSRDAPNLENSNAEGDGEVDKPRFPRRRAYKKTKVSIILFKCHLNKTCFFAQILDEKLIVKIQRLFENKNSICFFGKYNLCFIRVVCCRRKRKKTTARHNGVRISAAKRKDILISL